MNGYMMLRQNLLDKWVFYLEGKQPREFEQVWTALHAAPYFRRSAVLMFQTASVTCYEHWFVFSTAPF